MLNFYMGLVVELGKYSIDAAFSLFEWSFNYKKTKSVLLLSVGPFSVSVFNNQEIFKKIKDQIENKDKYDATSRS